MITLPRCAPRDITNLHLPRERGNISNLFFFSIFFILTSLFLGHLDCILFGLLLLVDSVEIHPHCHPPHWSFLLPRLQVLLRARSRVGATPSASAQVSLRAALPRVQQARRRAGRRARLSAPGQLGENQLPTVQGCSVSHRLFASIHVLAAGGKSSLTAGPICLPLRTGAASIHSLRPFLCWRPWLVQVGLQASLTFVTRPKGGR